MTIDPEGETFIVQRRPDGRLLIQAVHIDRLQVRQSREVQRGSGLYAERTVIALQATLVGGGLYTPEEAARGFAAQGPAALEN